METTHTRVRVERESQSNVASYLNGNHTHTHTHTRVRVERESQSYVAIDLNGNHTHKSTC